jgi:hypothetical protein
MSPNSYFTNYYFLGRDYKLIILAVLLRSRHSFHKLKSHVLLNVICISAILFLQSQLCVGQDSQSAIKVGVFYFDGWTGKTPHITTTLKDSLLESKPVWGWVTSTPKIMEKQIDVAVHAGISFFNFCWYFSRGKDSVTVDESPLNNALNLYLRTPNKKHLEFSLLIANHKGFTFSKEDWPELCAYWCDKFKNSSYVLVDGKPLITFFLVQNLIDTFGSSDNVNTAMQEFRSLALKKGFKGLSIAAVVDPSRKSIKLAEDCGFDILTGYNYHENGFGRTKNEIVSIDSMSIKERQVWNWLSELGHKPVIPVVTSNWDRRGGDKGSIKYSQRFSGYSQASIKNSVSNCKSWLIQNKSHTLKENIMFIYAWNEYGEGAWLTPSNILKNSLLDGLKQGLNN